MDKKEPFITKKMLLWGIALGMFSFIINLGFIYYDDTITFQCLNGTKEIYYKENLSQEPYICGNLNIFIYNDNSGFGIYLPNEITKNYAKTIVDKKKLNINLS